MTEQELGLLADEIRLAGKASEVLDSDAFKAAFKQVDDALLAAMKNAPIENDKLRLRLLDKYESLHALMRCLVGMVETGQMAEEQLKAKTIAEKIKDFVWN